MGTSFTKQIILFLHECGPPGLQWVSVTVVSRGSGSPLQYNVWSTWCWEQLLKRVSYLHWGCWCSWNWCSVELVQFFRALQCTRLKGQAESAALQDWELQRNFQSYIGFIKLIKITPSPKWATALLTLCCGSWNSECDSLTQWQWEATDRKQLPPCLQRGTCSEQSAVSVPEVLQLPVYPIQRHLCLSHRFK